MKVSSVIHLARNPWLAALLLVTFFARAMVPTGFMPGAGGLILCNGFAHSSVAHISAMDRAGMDMAGMDMSGMDVDSQAGHSGHDGNASSHDSMGMCPFAAAATALASPQAAQSLVLAHLVSTTVGIPRQPFVPRGTIVPTRLPRGPPSYS